MTSSMRALALVGLPLCGGCAAATPARPIDADKANLRADAMRWLGLYAVADGDGMAGLYTWNSDRPPTPVPASTQ